MQQQGLLGHHQEHLQAASRGGLLQWLGRQCRQDRLTSQHFY